MPLPSSPTLDPIKGPAATPIAFICAIVMAYQRYGVDPAGALRQAHIAPALLKNPHARITAAQMEIVSGAAMQELDDEALGWFSRKLPWGSYGMLSWMLCARRIRSRRTAASGPCASSAW